MTLEAKSTRGMKGSRHKARALAMQAMYQWQMTQQSTADIERLFISDDSLADADVEYFQHLVREIPQRLADLNGRISPHLDRAIGDVDPVERAILLIGAYELAFHHEIPYRVVLNEAIELAKKFGADQGHKYVNAVLDRLALELRASEAAAAR